MIDEAQWQPSYRLSYTASGTFTDCISLEDTSDEYQEVGKTPIIIDG